MSRASYLMMYDEVTWGVKPDSPTYFFTPILGNYGVRFRPQVRRMRPTIGVFEEKRSTKDSGYPAGGIAVPLYGYRPAGIAKSLAQIFLDWGFGDLETCTRPSKGAQWFQHICQGTDVLNTHNGLRVQRARLSGQAVMAGSGFVYMELGLVGKDEAAFTPAQTLPTDMKGLQEMRFSAATFSIAGTPTGIEEFSLEATFDLKVVMLNSTRPEAIRGGTDTIRLSLKPIKTSNAWDIIRRTQGASEFAVVITLTGPHAGTGGMGTTNTVATITMSRCAFTDKEDSTEIAEIDMETLEFDVLKPDNSNAAIVIAYTET